MELEQTDRQLLNELQAGIPLAADPFAELAGKLGVQPDELIQRARRLKSVGIIRQISAIFDTAALGYSSSLVAARFDASRIAAGAEVINRHPGVTHNYRRNHEYNLWFTVAVPPASRLGLERTVEILAAESGAEVARLLPALRLFKIGVKFDMDAVGAPSAGELDDPGETSADTGRPATQVALTERNVAMIRVLQDDLPLARSPFDEWAGRAGATVGELLEAAANFQRQGLMRRFAAVLHHRQAGYLANAMGVWAAPADRVEEVGRRMAAFAAVSHCYQRPTFADWPYNLFTMVHGRSTEACERELAAIRRATGVERMAVLYSLEEYKKTRLRYFTGEIEAWEAEHA